jgi:NADH-ubiquinone oxidoreductase chain 1
VVGVLIRVAFIVLVERKVLGYIQLRKGPNKVGFIGILQSFGDAIKLFTKEQIIPSYSNLIPFYFSPVISFLVVLLLWSLIPTGAFWLNIELGSLFFFCCTSFGVYTLLGRGWSSNSNYALLGAIRGVAQTVSYEVAIALLFLSTIFLIKGYNFGYFGGSQDYCWFLIFIFPIFLSWVSSSLAETNRTPFDFAEGESELVSGFNIEYGRGGFALLFLAEYASIIFISYFISIIFLGGINLILFNLIGLFFCYVFVWVRGTLPRFRYDKLIGLAWKSYLPISLNFLLFYISIRVVSIIVV